MCRTPPRSILASWSGWRQGTELFEPECQCRMMDVHWKREAGSSGLWCTVYTGTRPPQNCQSSMSHACLSGRWCAVRSSQRTAIAPAAVGTLKARSARLGTTFFFIKREPVGSNHDFIFVIMFCLCVFLVFFSVLWCFWLFLVVVDGFWVAQTVGEEGQSLFFIKREPVPIGTTYYYYY